MLAWLRRDEAPRGWPLWLLVTVLNTSVFAGVFTLQEAGRQATIPGTRLVLAAWAGVALYLVLGHTRTRARQFHLALPLSVRRLWLGHVGAVVLVAAAVALVSLAGELGQLRLLRGRAALDVGPLGLAAYLFAGVVLAVVLLQRPAMTQARVPFTLGYAAWAIAALAAVAGLLALLVPLGPAWSLLVLALGLALGGWELTALPRAFSLVPRAAARASAAPATREAARLREWEGGKPATRGVVVKALLRGVSAGPMDWASLSLTAIFGAVIGGGLALLSSDTGDLRYAYVPLLSYMLYAAIPPRLGRLHHLDALPISRRVLFACLVAPYFAACVAGYGLGARAADRAARRMELVGFPATGEAHSVTVPMWARRIAWDGRPPASISPQGESHVPRAWPLWRGSRAALYSPFSTPPGSS